VTRGGHLERAIDDFSRKSSGTRLAIERRHTMRSVLFVSHDGDLRAVAARVFARAGMEIKTVPHGGHALLACVERGSFDVLVIEDVLPEGPGAAIAARLRRHCPALHIVRMCDAGRGTDGAGNAVVRPFTADDLIAAAQILRARGATSR
jgi:DNA-binding NtrC family response regulator